MIEDSPSACRTQKRTTPARELSSANLATFLERVLRPLVRTEMRRLWKRQEVGTDLAADGEIDALVTLWESAEGWRDDPAVAPEVVEAYARTVARRTAEGMLRARYPERFRLAGRLRYATTHTPGLALWRENGALLVGLDTWRETNARVAIMPLVTDPYDRHLVRRLLGRDATQVPLAKLATALLELAGGPVPFQKLVSAIAQLQGLKEPQQVAFPAEDEDNALSALLARLGDIDIPRLVELRTELSVLWEEIQNLSLKQRTVLLLNLRDPQGRGVIALLPLLNIATMEEIAETLEMEDEAFAALWDSLPLPDEAIASRLGVSVRQITDLRYVARQRLLKRMQARESEP